MREWKNTHCKEVLIQSSRKRGPVEIKELPQKRQRRPLLLGEEMEAEVKSFIEVTCEKGAIVNSHTIMEQPEVLVSAMIPTCF